MFSIFCHRTGLTQTHTCGAAFFFFNDPATTEIYTYGHTRSLHDARPTYRRERHVRELGLPFNPPFTRWMGARPTLPDYLPAIGRSRRVGNLVYAFGHRSEEHTSELQ